ncbi:MAG: hypothetical protein A2494_00780 [Candidatus Lloydbacteria bacterium RIFOXYC12_FULL_46_25]|uniref:DUF3800 domain-containing protein n=1 Tax=Candidatus Lloydbacteria bacterium RIFOXYC12_FULL_46_25 TaxID=1798670 RepID=A0A1G2DVX6_9BACT|nr:MAG: hypothetical protein A2494_00780 [Candidatus Lloydbacteria bacterium RIFOXYC12_FULL_46_25]
MNNFLFFLLVSAILVLIAMYIFLDESGQFTKHNHEEYFVIGSFTVGNQRRTEKAFKTWHHSRFPKKMRKQNEIKWSSTGVNSSLRLRTLKNIAKLDIRIRYGYLLRENIPEDFKRNGKLESGLLYAAVIADIIKTYFPTDEKEIYIFCDNRHLKGLTRNEFRESIKAQLLPICQPSTFVDIQMIDSSVNANIQIADWISGALAWHLEKKPLGEDCYKIIKNNILSGKEFFR